MTDDSACNSVTDAWAIQYVTGVYTDDERLDSSGDVVAGGFLAYSDVHVRHVTEEVDDSGTSRRHFSPRVAHAHEEPASHIHTHTHTP